MDNAGLGLGLTLRTRVDSAKPRTRVSLPIGNANSIPRDHEDLTQKDTCATGKPRMQSLRIRQERLFLRKPSGLFLRKPHSSGLAVDRWPMLYRQIYQPANFDLHHATLALTTWNRGERQSAQTGASVFQFDGGRLALMSRKSNFSSNFLRYTQQMHLSRGSKPKLRLVKKSMSDTAVISPRRQRGALMFLWPTRRKTWSQYILLRVPLWLCVILPALAKVTWVSTQNVQAWNNTRKQAACT